MPTTEAETLDRLNKSRERLDRVVDAKVAMEHQRWRSEAQARSDALDEERLSQLEHSRKQADSCRRHQERYDSAYRGLGLSGAPAPDAGEFGGDYRRRLMKGLQDKLSSSHPFADVDPNDLNTAAIKAIEPQIIEAAEQEAAQPSPENLPRDDSMIARTRTDPMTNARVTNWYGRESFIKSMSRPARKVLRLIDPNDGRVLWGRPWSLPPT